jgi:TonB family protein
MKSPSNSSAYRLAAGAALGLVFLAAGTSVAPASNVYIPPKVDMSCPTPSPDVPESATHNGEYGNVILNILVSTQGRPRKVRILKSSGFDDLDNAAVEAAATWRYHPAYRDGSLATDWMKLDFDFKPVPPNHHHIFTVNGPETDPLHSQIPSSGCEI